MDCGHNTANKHNLVPPWPLAPGSPSPHRNLSGCGRPHPPVSLQIRLSVGHCTRGVRGEGPLASARGKPRMVSSFGNTYFVGAPEAISSYLFSTTYSLCTTFLWQVWCHGSLFFCVEACMGVTLNSKCISVPWKHFVSPGAVTWKNNETWIIPLIISNM